MKVKMLIGITGLIDGKNYPEQGEIGDLPTQVAEHLIENGYAERVATGKVESASVDPVEETASKSTAKPRKV